MVLMVLLVMIVLVVLMVLMVIGILLILLYLIILKVNNPCEPHVAELTLWYIPSRRMSIHTKTMCTFVKTATETVIRQTCLLSITSTFSCQSTTQVYSFSVFRTGINMKAL